MADRSHLKATLSRIDGRAYRGYRDLSRYYEMGALDLAFDQIQADPFAAPSSPSPSADLTLGFMESDVQNPVRRRALADFLARRISRACDDLSQRRGSGSSGVIRTFGGGQEVLDRAAVVFADHHLQVRLRLGLPAQGRRVLGRQAQAMLCDDLQRLVDDHLPAERHDETALKLHLDGVRTVRRSESNCTLKAARSHLSPTVPCCQDVTVKILGPCSTDYLSNLPRVSRSLSSDPMVDPSEAWVARRHLGDCRWRLPR